MIATLVSMAQNIYVIWAVAGAICLLAGVYYRLGFSSAAVQLESGLGDLCQALEKAAALPIGTMAERMNIVSQAAEGHPGVATAWRQTERRFVGLPREQGELAVLFGSPRDLWTPAQLLAGRVNLALMEAMPNLLVGVGLLFTFFFLTLALMEATSALTVQSDNQAPLLDATRGLLGSASGKFLTSLAGLLASVVWTVAFKHRMEAAQKACDAVLRALVTLVPAEGGEKALRAQLDQAIKLQSTVDEHRGLAAEQRDLASELLDEAREQTGTFKRFETDLAVTLGKTITDAFSPQMQSMTQQLVGALENLSERIGTMNQEALERMMRNHAGIVREATQHEMDAFRAALTALSNRLDAAGGSVQAGAEAAAGVLSQAGSEFKGRLDEASGQLAEGTAAAAQSLSGAGHELQQALEQGAQTLKTGVEAAAGGLTRAGSELEAAVQRAGASLSQGVQALEGALRQLEAGTQALGSVMGEISRLTGQGAEQLKQALEESGRALERLQTLGRDWATAIESLRHVSLQMAGTLDGMRTLSQQQREVVQAVKEATPSALNAVERVAAVLDKSALDTATAMRESREAMDATARTLETTVAAVTQGASEYSKQITELHRQLDRQMATAVKSLDGSINSLTDAVDGLEDMLDKRIGRKLAA